MLNRIAESIKDQIEQIEAALSSIETKARDVGLRISLARQTTHPSCMRPEWENLVDRLAEFVIAADGLFQDEALDPDSDTSDKLDLFAPNKHG